MMGQWRVKEAGSALRRIILVLAVATLMAAMMAVSAMPAMARNTIQEDRQDTPGPPNASFGSDENVNSPIVFHGEGGVKGTCVEHFDNEGQRTKLTGCGAPGNC